MAKKKTRGWSGRIPFSMDREPSEWEKAHGNPGIIKGGQLGYANDWRYDDEEKDLGKPDRFGTYWLDNFVFEDTLEFDHCARGRSAATFHFKRSDGSKVQFFMQETARLFPFFDKGKVTGRFTFVKRGANYSCSIIDPSESASSDS
jgi:hypothetical protein